MAGDAQAYGSVGVEHRKTAQLSAGVAVGDECVLPHVLRATKERSLAELARADRYSLV